MTNLVPTKVFLTKGVGRHKYRLKSFEEALRKAGVAHQNLVQVSSILPPKCKIGCLIGWSCCSQGQKQVGISQ
jgi:arginine decarboxylase